jgi:16S rRNA G966 N2-methylase RsmD
VTRIFRRDATDLGPCTHAGGFGLALLDPPYDKGLAAPALAALAGGGWLKPGALAIVEERQTAGFAWPAGYAALDQRAYGDTALSIGRREH